jgi:broad specificity phosphatase PhoE
MTTQLYLIRHGESVPNVEPVIGGMRGDAGLTDRGREQAHLLQQRLRTEELRARPALRQHTAPGVGDRRLRGAGAAASGAARPGTA